MDQINLMWRMRCHHQFICVIFFCISVILLYAFYSERNVPMYNAAIAVQTQPMTRPRANPDFKVLQGRDRALFTDPQNKTRVIVGDHRHPVLTLSPLSPNPEDVDSLPKLKRKELYESFATMLPRSFVPALAVMVGNWQKEERTAREEPRGREEVNRNKQLTNNKQEQSQKKEMTEGKIMDVKNKLSGKDAPGGNKERSENEELKGNNERSGKETQSRKKEPSVQKVQIGNKQQSGEKQQSGNEGLSSKKTKQEQSGKAGDTQYEMDDMLRKKVWNEETSSNMLGSKMKNIWNYYQTMNNYGVKVPGSGRISGRPKLTGPELLCRLKETVPVMTLTSDLKPFSALPWASQLPMKQMTSDLGTFKTCAVVSSAGAILSSRLGKEIDSHDAVIRFNGAPTRGFEVDVGSKTTLHLFNSKVMSKNEYHFLSSPLYHSGVLVAWDPAPFSSDLTEWYNHTEFPIFNQYQKYKKLHPQQPFYILHPRFNWQLWQLIQDNMDEPIPKYPPSSGFLGIVLMMSLCEVVHVYEFLPSHRRTALCHYYEQIYDDSCTIGTYHPLMYEKNLVKRMNLGSDDEIYLNGRVMLPGLSTLKCTDGVSEH